MNLASKIFGWVLLLGGVLIISWTLYSSYNIFTAKDEAPEVFKVEKEITRTPVTTQGKHPATPAELQKEMERMVGEQLKSILPPDTLPKFLNLVVWSMLAFILIFGGTQISSLGIKLIKK
jgi:hypothetical protein